MHDKIARLDVGLRNTKRSFPGKQSSHSTLRWCIYVLNEASGADAQKSKGDLGVPALHAWRRSSRCGGAGACVEVADLGARGMAVRDGKVPETSPVLFFSDEEWRSFLSGVKAGDFDR